MSRRSRRELERALDDLAHDAADAVEPAVAIQYDVVGPNGTVVDTFERTLTVGR